MKEAMKKAAEMPGQSSTAVPPEAPKEQKSDSPEKELEMKIIHV